MISVQWSQLGRIPLSFLKKCVFEEERKHTRVPYRGLVKHSPSDTDAPRISNLVDLSEGGAKIFSKEKLQKGEVLRLLISLPDMKADIPALARVQWVEEVPGKYRQGACWIGVQFIDLDPDCRKLIQKFIKHRKLSK